MLGLGIGVCQSAHAAEWIYTVVDGDNLWEISERYLDTPLRYEALRRLNDVRQPKRMPPGMRIRVPMQWIRSNPVPATLAEVNGEARLVRAGTTQAVALQPGAQIQLGDTLRTAAQASAAIRFADGSVVTVRGDSEVRFDHLSAHGKTGMVDSRLNLLKGRLDTRVKPATGPGSRFQIETPSAISAVRGTAYRAAVDQDARASNVEVLGGKVAVAGANASRVVPAGFGTRIETGAPPLPPRALLAEPKFRAVPTPIRQLHFNLTWDALPKARAYRIEIGRDAQFNTLLWERVSGRAGSALPDLPDGEYQVRVRGIDDLGLEGRDAQRGISLDVHPQPPVPLKPLDGQTLRGETAELQWTASNAARRYRLEIAADADFAALLVDKTLDGTRYTSSEITEPGAYHWRVTSVAEDGELGPPASTRSWIRKPMPAAVSPQLAAVDDQLLASWPAAAGAHAYQIQLAHDTQFRDLEIDRTTSEPSLRFAPLSGQVRYLRARVVEADGFKGPWGTVQRVDPPPDPTRWLVPVLGILGLILL